MSELPAIDLEGFDPKLGCGEYEWGPPVTNPYEQWKGQPWQDHAFHMEVLSWHYHDYMGTHAFVQVWDYRQQTDDEQRWQYLLLLHRPTKEVVNGVVVSTEWAWTIAREYEVGKDQRPPTNAEVGADVDRWLEAPDVLKFILE